MENALSYGEDDVRRGFIDPQSVAFGDFDDDGYNDMAVVDFGSDILSIWINNATGTEPDFDDQPTQTFLLREGQSANTSKPILVLSHNFDGSPGDDLAILNYIANYIIQSGWNSAWKRLLG